MKRLVSVFLVLLLVLSGIASALGEAAKEEVEITRNMIGDGKNVLRIVMDGEPFSVKAMQEVLTKFFEETGISVELMFVPSSGGWAGFNSKIQTMIAGGDTPDVIRLAIGHYRGRMTEVARRLGIGRSTLYRKLAELGIDNAA